MNSNYLTENDALQSVNITSQLKMCKKFSGKFLEARVPTKETFIYYSERTF